MDTFKIQVVKVVEKKPATAVSPLFEVETRIKFAQELLRLRLEHCEKELEVILKGDYYTTEDSVISANGMHRFCVPTHEFLQKLNGCYNPIDSNAGNRKVIIGSEAIILQTIRTIPMIDEKFVEKFEAEFPANSLSNDSAIRIKEVQTVLLNIFSEDLMWTMQTKAEVPWCRHFIKTCE